MKEVHRNGRGFVTTPLTQNLKYTYKGAKKNVYTV